jgi:hypothetical protein
MSTTHPTYDEFVRHAHRFGVECVYETAASYLIERELALLRSELDELTPKRRSDVELIEQVIALRDEGLVPAAIADKLRLGERRVRSILSTSRPTKTRGEKPLNQAAKSARFAVGRSVGHPGASEPVEARTAA